MKDIKLLGPGVVVTAFGTKGKVIDRGAVVWQGNRITDVGSFDELSIRYAGARLVNAHGGLILPGLVNLHHHFYSALARGLDPGVRTADFGEILAGLWWRLDRALDPDTIRLSAALSLADCIRWGCTTVFDHHASPTFVRGSLTILEEEVDRAGLGAVLCYEISDRNSHNEALAGLEENLDLAGRGASNPQVRALLGLHASFTVSDDTLDRVARDRPDDLGIHIHLAEDALDAAVSRERYSRGPLERLEAFGLLDERAVLVHGVHLGCADFRRIGDSGATLVHNPESNNNNAVGRLDLQLANKCGCRVGLGTDGMSSSMLRALRSAFLTLRGGAGNATLGFDIVPGLLDINAQRAALAFDEPLLGRLDPGAQADIIVVDPAPPTPLTASNAFGHLAYGAAESTVRHTIARGKVLLEEYRHTTIDVEALAEEARRATPGLWRRFRKIR